MVYSAFVNPGPLAGSAPSIQPGSCMNKLRGFLILGLLPLAFLLSSCEEPTTDVTVSGTLTRDGWVQGSYFAVAFQEGTPA